MYHCILPEQAIRLFPHYDEIFMRNVIERLNYKRRIKLDQASGCLMEPLCKIPADKWMLRALWVLVDNQPEPGSHTAGEGLVKLSFVRDGTLLDVAAAPPGKEMEISLALQNRQGEKAPCAVILDSPEQAHKIDCTENTVFCTVSSAGKVQYFKKQEGAFHDN